MPLTLVRARSSGIRPPLGRTSSSSKTTLSSMASQIGNDVVLWSGNHIGHRSEIGDHCYLASHVVVSGYCKVGESWFIGVNATLADNVTVGANCLIGAGAVVLKDAPADTIYQGTSSAASKVSSLRFHRIGPNE